MSIDTKAKRMSILNYCMPSSWGQLFEVDGTVDADDRAVLLHFYGGLIGVVPYVEPLPQRIVRHTGRYV